MGLYFLTEIAKYDLHVALDYVVTNVRTCIYLHIPTYSHANHVK